MIGKEMVSLLAAVLMFASCKCAAAEEVAVSSANPDPRASSEIARPLDSTIANWTERRVGHHAEFSQIIGWNYYHPMACNFFSTTSALTIFYKEGGSANIGSSIFQALLEPSCQTGNWIGVHVYFIDSNDVGSVDAVGAFDYR